jgi:hypothetical protein
MGPGEWGTTNVASEPLDTTTTTEKERVSCKQHDSARGGLLFAFSEADKWGPTSGDADGDRSENTSQIIHRPAPLMGT